jgi:hypothetical protein
MQNFVQIEKKVFHLSYRYSTLFMGHEYLNAIEIYEPYRRNQGQLLCPSQNWHVSIWSTFMKQCINNLNMTFFMHLWKLFVSCLCCCVQWRIYGYLLSLLKNVLKDVSSNKYTF